MSVKSMGELLDVFNDKEAVDDLLSWLSHKRRFQARLEISSRWGSLKTLPDVIDKWVRLQLEPFLSIKTVSETGTGSTSNRAGKPSSINLTSVQGGSSTSASSKSNPSNNSALNGPMVDQGRERSSSSSSSSNTTATSGKKRMTLSTVVNPHQARQGDNIAFGTSRVSGGTPKASSTSGPWGREGSGAMPMPMPAPMPVTTIGFSPSSSSTPMQTPAMMGIPTADNCEPMVPFVPQLPLQDAPGNGNGSLLVPDTETGSPQAIDLAIRNLSIHIHRDSGAMSTSPTCDSPVMAAAESAMMKRMAWGRQDGAGEGAGGGAVSGGMSPTDGGAWPPLGDSITSAAGTALSASEGPDAMASQRGREGGPFKQDKQAPPSPAGSTRSLDSSVSQLSLRQQQTDRFRVHISSRTEAPAAPDESAGAEEGDKPSALLYRFIKKERVPDVDVRIRRLAAVYARLLITLHLPLATTMDFVARLFGLPCLTCAVRVETLDSARFKTLLNTDEDILVFLLELLQYLAPLFRSLGRRIVLALSETDLVGKYAQRTRGILQDAVDEDSGSSSSSNKRGQNTSSSLSEGLSGTFIRPFREDVDSRHEYRTPQESQAYNERERCFDDFSNLFRSFQDEARGDLDGSKMTAFWLRPHVGDMRRRIMGLRDSNVVWFAEIFKSMLLFYGLNSPSRSVSAMPSRDGKQGGGGGSVGQQKQSSTRLKHSRLEERLGPGGQGDKGSSLHQTNHIHKLRFPGGYGGRPPTARAPTSGGGHHSPDALEEAAVYFPGSQQFFLRLLAGMDSHRFATILRTALEAEVRRLSCQGAPGSQGVSGTGGSGAVGGTDGKSMAMATQGQGQGQTQAQEPLPLRVAKLMILGRFLGFLNFSPFWTSGADVTDWGTSSDGRMRVAPGSSTEGEEDGSQSPLAIVVREAAARRTLSDAHLVVKQALEDAWRDGRLTLAVPWVVGMLQMLRWDPVLALRAPLVEVLALLAHMTNAPLLHLSQDLSSPLSPNRAFVVMEIQTLLFSQRDQVLSAIRRVPEPPLLRRSRDDKGGVVLDEGGAVFAGALAYVAPYLDQAVQSLTPKIMVAGSSRRTYQPYPQHQANPPTSVASSTTKKKRQTPHQLSASAATYSMTRATSFGSVGSFPDSAPVSMVHGSGGSASERSPSATSALDRAFHGSAGGASTSVTTTKDARDVFARPDMRSPLTRALSLGNSGSGGGLPSDGSGGSANAMLTSPLAERHLGRRTPSPRNGPSIHDVSSSALSSSSSSAVGGTSPNGPLRVDAVDMALERSFWQKHPHLEDMAGFLLDLVRSSCHRRMQDRVAHAVRQYWARVADIRADIGVGGDTSPPSSSENLAARLEHALSSDLQRVLAETMEGGRALLDSSLERTLTVALPELCTLHPAHPRVMRMAMYLIRSQARAEVPAALDFLSSYATRKLGEVCSLSLTQHAKAVAAARSTGRRPSRPESEPALGPTPTVTQQGGKIPPVPETDPEEAEALLRQRVARLTDLTHHLDARGYTGEGGDVHIHGSEGHPLYGSRLTGVLRADDAMPFSELEALNVIGRLSIMMCDVMLAAAQCVAAVLDPRPISELDVQSTHMRAIETIVSRGSMLVQAVHDVLLRSSTIGKAKKAGASTSPLALKMRVDLIKFFMTALPHMVYTDAFAASGKVCAAALLLRANAAHLLDDAAVVRIITAACRKSTVAHQVACRGLDGLGSRQYRRTLLSLIGAFLRNVRDRHDAPLADLDFDIDSDSEWFSDPSCRRSLKNVFSKELADVVTTLSRGIEEVAL